MTKEHFSIIDIDLTLFPLEEALLNYVRATVPEEANEFMFALQNLPTYTVKRKIQAHAHKLPKLAALEGNAFIRQAGRCDAFHNTPPYQGSTEFLKKLHELSDILIVTARGTASQPDKHYDKGYAMTSDYLHRHQLVHDQLIFSPDKTEAAQQYMLATGKQPLLFFDDHPQHIAHAQQHLTGLTLAMRRQRHNEDYLARCNGSIFIVDDLRELADHLGL